MRYFIKLAYNGSQFHGWQRQPNANSVQQTLEEAFSIFFREKVEITGAGRTDAGVHAREMYAHFDLNAPLPQAALKDNADKILRSINKLCGPAISLDKLFMVDKDAHARFDAISREYKYFVVPVKTPFLNQFSWHSPSALDYKAMNEAAHILTEITDFTSFAKLHSDSKTNNCKVFHAEWRALKPGESEIWPQGTMVFSIKADRFLRNMVRAVVGTLVEVGRGKLDIKGFREIIEKKDRCSAGTSMPAKALFLWEIKYPFQT